MDGATSYGTQGREAKVNKQRRQDAPALQSPQLPAWALAGLIPLRQLHFTPNLHGSGAMNMTSH